MANTSALLNSMPSLSPAPWTLFQPAQGGWVTLAPRPYYNLRNEVRYDRNWGRSAWSVPGVQQYRPFNIVDPGDRAWQGDPVPLETDFRRTFYDPPFISQYAASELGPFVYHNDEAQRGAGGYGYYY